MRPIEQETNIEVLRQYSLWLQSQVIELSKEVVQLKESQEIIKQEWLEKSLRDQLSRLQKKFFGCGRESLAKSMQRPVGHSGEQLRLHGKYTALEASDENSDTKSLNQPNIVVHDCSAETLAKEGKFKSRYLL